MKDQARRRPSPESPASQEVPSERGPAAAQRQPGKPHCGTPGPGLSAGRRSSGIADRTVLRLGTTLTVRQFISLLSKQGQVIRGQ
eukprot:768602-Hanusia_phi.AAC.7